MYSTLALAKASKDAPFQKISIQRNLCGDDDVEFDIKYCGICHSDVHLANDDLGGYTKYPIVPGHELAGIVTSVGQNVSKLSVGDAVGVGCMVDSCLNCDYCKAGDEVACRAKFTATYNGDITHGRIKTDSNYTYGGYSSKMTVNQHFAVKVPKGYPLAAAGPVLCAGITMYTPLKQWGAVKGGKRVGVVGIGGLGLMGLKLAKAMGNTVTAISTKKDKEAAARAMGADHFVVSTSEEDMKEAVGSLDLIINTVSANHQVSHYLPLLARRGNICQLGAVFIPHQISQFSLMMGQTSVSGSAIGGMPDTQECIDFCAEKGVIADIEIVTGDQLLDVYKNLSGSNDRAVRYVLDVEKSLGTNIDF